MRRTDPDFSRRGRRTDFAWSKLIAAIVCAIVVSIGARCRAGTVRTADGRLITGDLRIEPGALVVQPRLGTATRLVLSDIASIDFSQQPADPVADAPGLGGLKGEYFTGTTFDRAGRKILRLDPTIDFTWKYGRQAPFMPNDWTWVPFCVRWTGRVRPLFSEKYTLRIRDPLPEGGEIHGRLWIDGRLVIDDGFDSGTINLQAGRLYDVQLDVVATRSDRQGKPSLTRFTWESRSQPPQVVPASCLYVPVNGTDDPVVARISSPPDQSEIFLPSPISINAQVEPGSHKIRSVELRDNQSLLKTFPAGPITWQWTNAAPGDHELRVVALTDDGQKWPSGTHRIIIAANDGGHLRKPWARFDIGGDGHQEPVSFAGNSITLQRAGGELLAGRDQCQFVFQMLAGDGEITAKLDDVAVDAPNSAGLAGLMIRRSLDADSRECAILFQPGAGTVFLHRVLEGQSSINSPTATPNPGYLRLVRDGHMIRGYRSDDGTAWQFVDQQELDLPGPILIGLVVSAQSTANVTAHFESAVVTASHAPRNYAARRTGLQLIDGTRLIGDIVKLTVSSVTVERSEKTARQDITVDLKAVSTVTFRPPPPASSDAPEASWQGVVLSNGDLYGGDVKVLNDRNIQVISDVFGPREFNWDHELTSVRFAPVQSRPSRRQITLADGSVLYPDHVSLVQDGITVQTVFAKSFHFGTGEVVEMRNLQRIAPTAKQTR